MLCLSTVKIKPGNADAGAHVLVTGGKLANMGLHYANKYNIMLVRLNSKQDLRRLHKKIGATALCRLTPSILEEIFKFFGN